MPMAMAATASTVRCIEFPSLVSGLAPGFSDNPDPSLLFLKTRALREQPEDHELVNMHGRARESCAGLSQPTPPAAALAPALVCAARSRARSSGTPHRIPQWR